MRSFPFPHGKRFCISLLSPRLPDEADEYNHQYDIQDRQDQRNDHQVIIDRGELLAQGEIVTPVNEPRDHKADPLL